jgi:DNA invertase Pin-like site-specific DNA recombinase
MLICRISDRKQLDGVSLDAQKRHLREYAENNNLIIAHTASFQESAKASKLRPQFHAAIEEGERLKVRHLVFYMFDRVSRNYTDLEMLEELVQSGEIVLHIASGNVVLHKDSDDSSFFMSDINVAQAKQENRTRRRKTIDGMIERCMNAWYPSRPPSFYVQQPLIDDNGRMKRRGSTIVGPTEEGRLLVRREMELHLKGYSLDRIRDICLSEGLVPSKSIPTYRRSAIDKHLKTPFYAAIADGDHDFRSQFVWRGVRYKGKHTPIFTVEEWAKLQASFGLRSSQRKLKHEGLFAQGLLSLRCAEPTCGCKITYAPKEKANGTVYHYYRCADGKRVHVGRGEPQVNVREEDILDQLGGVVDAISVTEDIAEAITVGLNETHRQVKAAKANAVKTYKAQLLALNEKENRIVDMFASGSIDGEVFKRQQVRVREEREGLFNKLQEAEGEADDAYLVTAQRVLELAKTAKTL